MKSTAMWALVLLSVALCSALVSATSSLPNRLEFAALLHSFAAEELSSSSSIEPGDKTPTRWSSYDAPHPLFVVNVATEQDVANVVKFLYLNHVTFLAQNGGSAWYTFSKNISVIINLQGLNQFSPSVDKSLTTIGGGLYINDTLSAAWDAGIQVQTANCPCLGVLGPYLGGGYGNLLGLYGFGVDQVVSFRLVTPQGNLITVSNQTDPDLFWALRGAGPNFGIVTSAVIKSFPVPQNESFAWTGDLVFDSEYLEDVVTAISKLDLQPHMNVFMYFVSLGGPPVVLTTPFLYQGNNASFHQAFASLYAIPFIEDATGHVDYKDFNNASQYFCTRGALKPSYGAGLVQLVPSVWRNIWNEYIKFQALPTAQNSIVLLEVYSLIKARSIPLSEQGAFPFRDLSFNSVAIPWYTDPSLDAQALAFGGYVRDQWRSASGLPHGQNATYINFAHGDEDNEVVYSTSLSRLQQVKKRVDPTNVMSQWFNILV